MEAARKPTQDGNVAIAGVKVRGVKHRIQLLLVMRSCVETPHEDYKSLNLNIEPAGNGLLPDGRDTLVLKRH
ncbi:hypothetical protein AGR2A_Lc150148 [Agrobacterium genomosp. 2 str. CFBP 5494]|uniref:Uncharacterized protein n=1 Tax=Agrobacterium genomosp. 2 str. CFBP 5494 TaxID=1183436 RepID=A0A9W5B370_9HYPH|nr:hypothetical protein AGR2A_Lc150148 [Agrobacterium genomosp. 2 str. CFBP 5494]